MFCGRCGSATKYCQCEWCDTCGKVADYCECPSEMEEIVSDEQDERFPVLTRSEREGLRDVRKLPAVPKFVLGQRVVYRGEECTIIDAGVEAGEIVYDNSLGRWGYEGQYTAVAS